ncbi:MAG: hypothetical protein HYZ65_15750 [Burkholderiales bacterium]|nr:hypothetical protein [Burkholderiales bacterium]
MQIDSVISSIQVSQASRQVAPETVAVTAQKIAEAVNLETADHATQIMQNYDLHNMAYPEIVKMAGELRDAGIITIVQAGLLSAPGGERLKLVSGQTVFDNRDEKDIVYEKKDYIENFELHLASAEKSQDISTINHMKSIVNILHNLDALSAKA